MYRVGQKCTPNSWPQFCQILTDFQNSFTGRFCNKFAVKWVLQVHCAHVVTTLLEDEENAPDNHVLACNFAKYSPI